MAATAVKPNWNRAKRVPLATPQMLRELAALRAAHGPAMLL